MRSVLGLLFFFTVVSITYAQSETANDGWEIVERCVLEPTTAPDDYSYNGTIIMWGGFGLHGVRADWETPRVLAFLPNGADSDSKLSPDGGYFAHVNREFHEAIPSNLGGIVEVDSITIYDTSDNTEAIYEIPIENSYSVHNRDWSVRQLRWLDNTHIIYEVGNEGGQFYNLEYVKVINITTGEQTDWEYPINPIDNHDVYPSPNLEYIAQGQASLAVTSIMTGDILLDDTDLGLDRFAYILGVTWSAKSDIAIVTTRNNDLNNYYLIGFAPDEGARFTIEIPNGGFRYNPAIAISTNSRYVAYFYETLHIVDLETQSIVDTCINRETHSLAWSADSTMLAFHPWGAGQQPVYVYDNERHELHTVAYHNTSYYQPMVGWRAD